MLKKRSARVEKIWVAENGSFLIDGVMICVFLDVHHPENPVTSSMNVILSIPFYMKKSYENIALSKNFVTNLLCLTLKKGRNIYL